MTYAGEFAMLIAQIVNQIEIEGPGGYEQRENLGNGAKVEGNRRSAK